MANYQEYATYGRNLSRTRTDKFGRGGRGKKESVGWIDATEGRWGGRFRTASLQEVIADSSLPCKLYRGEGERRQTNSAAYFFNLAATHFSHEYARVYQNRKSAMLFWYAHTCVCARTLMHVCNMFSHFGANLWRYLPSVWFFREVHNFCPSPFLERKDLQ